MINQLFCTVSFLLWLKKKFTFPSSFLFLKPSLTNIKHVKRFSIKKNPLQGNEEWKNFAEETDDFLRLLSLLEYCPARSCKNTSERAVSLAHWRVPEIEKRLSACYLCLFKDRKRANPKQLCSQRDARKFDTICDSLIYVMLSPLYITRKHYPAELWHLFFFTVWLLRWRIE